nr:DUF5946 family protein [Streptosporangium roseum]
MPRRGHRSRRPPCHRQGRPRRGGPRRPPDYFHRLEPPPRIGLTTAVDVLAARGEVEHGRLAWAWGRDVWQSWAPHHTTIRRWNTRALARPGT